MENISMMSDTMIVSKIGQRIKNLRLKQNITQESLACATNISLSSVKKIEKGEIKSFDSLLRVLRVLGRLDVFQSLVEEEQLTPREYYKFVTTSKKMMRKRAVGRLNNDKKNDLGW